MPGRLSGHVAFLAVGDDRSPALARALRAEGATVVVVVGAQDPNGGRLAAALGEGVAVFQAGQDVDVDADALAELAADLLPGRG